jgi:hypothetical protein
MTDDDAEKILSQIEPPDVIEGEHRRTLKERLLEAHSDKVESPNMLGTGILMATRSRIWLLPYAAAVAAACILVGLAFWMVERADKGGVRIGPEPRAVTIVAPTQRAAAKPADIPSADCLAYFRAWEKSPDSLENLLTRDAAVLLRPAPIESGLDGRRFLKTMNPIKEEHNEKHSMRGVASGALV